MGVSIGAVDQKNWRDLLFMSMKSPKRQELESVSVNIRMQYRRDTGQIWSIRVMDTWRVFRCSLYGLDNHDLLDQFVKDLGSPRKTEKESRSLNSYWWVREKLGYHMRVYSQDFPDVGITHHAGEAQWSFGCSFELVRSGIEGWFGEGT